MRGFLIAGELDLILLWAKLRYSTLGSLLKILTPVQFNILNKQR